jgi:hypothetical protein
MLRRHRLFSLAALASAAVIGATSVAPPASAGGDRGGGSTSPKVVATGLDNPRQLSFTRSGDLLVAEAGEGGAGPCNPGPEDPTALVCFGTSGAITKISSRGHQSRIITGLPSIAAQDTGAEASGPSDVAATGRNLSVLIGLGADPAIRSTLPRAGRRLGTLVETTRGYDGLRTVADIAGWEADNNPVPPADAPDSNPVGMLVDDGRYVVADAGGNTVLSVTPRGRIRQVAAFPTTRTADAPPFLGLPPGTQLPLQEVPTSVATKGRDGAYYVSQLTGFPFPKGAPNIYRVDPRTGRTTVYASGLTNVTDLAFDGRTLYAVQISTEGLLTGPTGSVVKIRPGGSSHTTVVGDLFAPYGIAISKGNAYVTTGAVAKDEGQVLRIRL